MEASLNEIYKAIGSLTSEVSGLRRDLQEAEDQAEKNNKSATESRTAVHRRLDEVIGRTAILEGQVERVQSDMVDVKVVTQQVTAWQQRGLGALGITGIASSAVTAGLVAYWDEIKRVIWGH